MALTPSQTTHLSTIIELSNRYGGGVTHAHLHEAVWGGKRGTKPTVTRAVNALEEQGLVQVIANAEGTDEYHPTDKGRAAVAQAGAVGTEDS